MKDFDTDHVARNLFEALRDLPHIKAGAHDELINTLTGEVITKCPDELGYDYGTFCVTPSCGERQYVPGHHYLHAQAVLAVRQAGAATEEAAQRRGLELLERLRERHGF
jgi:hypothetical protein